MTALAFPCERRANRLGLSDQSLAPVRPLGRQSVSLSDRLVKSPWWPSVVGDCGFAIPHVETSFRFELPNLMWSIEVQGPASLAFIETAYEIDRISALEANWDSYGGKPISEAAIEAALHLASKLLKQKVPKPHVVPMSSGGVCFEWHECGIDLEIEIENNDSIQVEYEQLGQLASDEFAVRLGAEDRISLLLDRIVDSRTS